MSKVQKAIRELVFALAVAAVTAVVALIPMSRAAAPLWYVVIPIACVLFLAASKIRLSVDPVTAASDLKRYWKVIAAFVVYNAVLVAAFALMAESPVREWSRVSFSFLTSNVIEELLFRATLIPFFEIIGRKLFDAPSTTRALVSSSIVFSLSHVGSLLYAVSTLERLAAIANLFSAFVIGIFLGIVYSRSRNLLSVMAFHWWFNLQNRMMQYLAFLVLS